MGSRGVSFYTMGSGNVGALLFGANASDLSLLYHAMTMDSLKSSELQVTS